MQKGITTLSFLFLPHLLFTRHTCMLTVFSLRLPSERGDPGGPGRQDVEEKTLGVAQQAISYTHIRKRKKKALAGRTHHVSKVSGFSGVR